VSGAAAPAEAGRCPAAAARSSRAARPPRTPRSCLTLALLAAARRAGIIDDDTWVAWRDIAVGEEVVYDYAASETGESTHMPFTCRCGAAACRGRITGDDCLLPELRAKYGSSFTTLTKAKQAAADAAAPAPGLVPA